MGLIHAHLANFIHTTDNNNNFILVFFFIPCSPRLNMEKNYNDFYLKPKELRSSL